jgi:hypothetical protein
MSESDGINLNPIEKSAGLTPSERILAELCERTFLKLWSYPNPIKDDGHELCDLLAVFGENVFIFFDREKQLVQEQTDDIELLWERWKRRVIDAQLRTADGAERYVRSGRTIFVDANRSQALPLSIAYKTAAIHKIVVAHGAKAACLRSSPNNIYGSLAINYSKYEEEPSPPFTIRLAQQDSAHVFDSHNLPIILGELDTVADFTMYLEAKRDAISKLDFLSYCGEEDLLAHYYLSFDDDKKRHFIGTKDPAINGVLIGEGEWQDFVASEVYKKTKHRNQISYMWDELLQMTSQNALDRRILGDPAFGQSPIREMAKEPRFSRRALSEQMRSAIAKFPDSVEGLARHVSLMPSFYPGTAYVFLQLWANDRIRGRSDYRTMRQKILEIACGSAKNLRPELGTVVGIGIDAPKHTAYNSEDFILMDCREWPAQSRDYYESLNRELRFFHTTSMRQFEKKVTEFVHPEDSAI